MSKIKNQDRKTGCIVHYTLIVLEIKIRKKIKREKLTLNGFITTKGTIAYTKLANSEIHHQFERKTNPLVRQTHDVSY